MLKTADATDETDRRIAEGLAKKTGSELRLLRYTRETKDAAKLRDQLEISDDYSGAVTPTGLKDGAAFFYICQDPHGVEIAHGEGDTPELAICDGVLNFLTRPPRP